MLEIHVCTQMNRIFTSKKHRFMCYPYICGCQ